MSIDYIARCYIALAKSKRFFLTGNFEENLNQAQFAFKDKCISLGLMESDIPSLRKYL